MTDRDRLLAAVRDEPERALVIADRAGIDRRAAGQKLAALVQQGLVVAKRNRSRRPSERVLLYRRDPSSPPVDTPLDAEAVLLGLRVKLGEMTGGIESELDDGYAVAIGDVWRWLGEQGVPS